MHTTIRQAAGFAAVLFTVSLGLGAPIAHADPAGVKDCASQGGVYVTIATPDATNGACVTAPASGAAALQAAGDSFSKDASGMICAINDYPNPCPATFDGHYWHYYQASATDAMAGHWAYATTGPDDSKPQAGWVEGWCYSAEQDCLPMPIDAAPSTVGPLATPSEISADVPSDQPGDTPPLIVDGPVVTGLAGMPVGLAMGIAAVFVVVVAIVVIAVVRGRARRKK